MFVVAVFDALVHTFKFALQFFSVSSQCFFNRCKQNRRADLTQDCIFVLPALGADELILETSKSLLS